MCMLCMVVIAGIFCQCHVRLEPHCCHAWHHDQHEQRVLLCCWRAWQPRGSSLGRADCIQAGGINCWKMAAATAAAAAAKRTHCLRAYWSLVRGIRRLSPCSLVRGMVQHACNHYQDQGGGHARAGEVHPLAPGLARDSGQHREAEERK
jgi:hypothetical protein